VFTGYTLLDQPTFWVILFYLISGSLSFQNIAAISIIQTVIALIRYATLIIMFVGAFMVIGDHGSQEIKYWDFKSFPNLFSTAVFAFMAHHSIPGMMRPIKPSSSIKYRIR
jgi:amino acid permease